MKTTGRFGVYLLVLVGLFGSGAAWGQSTNGSIRGIVNDPSGAVVPRRNRHRDARGDGSSERFGSLRQGWCVRHSRIGRRKRMT